MHLKIISNNSNEGFTKATNAGIRESAGKKIFLMNPDAKLTENALQFMIVKLDMDDTIGAAAPQLLNSNGSIQKSCRRFPEYFDMFCELTLLSYIFPESKIFSRWKMNYFDHNSEREVDQPMAAALMLKRSILEKTCAFDERFNMFFNDVDLCKKIYENENKIVFTPNAKVYHKKGVSIYKDRIRMIRIWNEDCLKYFKKYKYNIILYNWLLLNLKLSGFFRILYYKLKK